MTARLGSLITAACRLAANVEFHVAVVRASGNRVIELCANAMNSPVTGPIGDALGDFAMAALLDYI